MFMQISELAIRTSKRTQFVEITVLLLDTIRKEQWVNGILTVFSPHTTAGITINENADPDVAADMDLFLSRLIPQNSGFRHAEGNSDAHLKASLLGSSVQIIVSSGKLCLGTWQGVYFCDFDGPRSRKVLVAFSGCNP
jgi:secondary thiamine-phosphate synthase enzyme